MLMLFYFHVKFHDSTYQKYTQALSSSNFDAFMGIFSSQLIEATTTRSLTSIAEMFCTLATTLISWLLANLNTLTAVQTYLIPWANILCATLEMVFRLFLRVLHSRNCILFGYLCERTYEQMWVEQHHLGMITKEMMERSGRGKKSQKSSILGVLTLTLFYSPSRHPYTLS